TATPTPSTSATATATPTTSATATATPTTSATATPSTSPTSTATVAPPPTATATPGQYPFSVSAAPHEPSCNGKAHLIQPVTDRDAMYQPEEYYCRGVYSIGSKVVVY